MNNKYRKNGQNGVVEIDLIKLAKALWSRAFLIVLVALICACAMFLYTFFLIDPTYEANCEVYVNNSSISIGSTSLSISNNDLTASKSLVDTYIVILKSRTTLNEVIKVADLDYNYTQLLKMITAGSVNNTEVFNIKVTSTSPDEAKLIANTIAQVLPQKVSEIVDGSSVRIVDYAVKPVVKAAPSLTKNTSIGLIVGLFIACGYVTFNEIIDDIIHDEDVLSENVDPPVIGVIPDLDEEDTKNYYYYRKKYRKSYSDYKNYYKKNQSSINIPEIGQISDKQVTDKMLFSNVSFSAAEAYKLLRTNINFITSDSTCKIIGVTSPIRGEGKSTTSLNLAYTLAETGKRVLLIDSDLRIPTISKRMGIENKVGLSSILAGLATLEDAITPSNIFERWHIITAGDVPPNPNELLGLKKNETIFNSLSRLYDYIVVDFPPVNIVADAITMSRLVDGMIVVVRQDYSTLAEIRSAIKKFEMVNIKPLGFVLTDVTDRSKGYKYNKYRKYSGYHYKKNRYSDYGYTSYYEKNSYSDPQIYAIKSRKAKENKPVIKEESKDQKSPKKEKE